MDFVFGLFDIQMLHLGAGLLILICVNILLGSMTAIIQKQFNKEKFVQGLLKGVIISVSFVLVYFAGALNPDVFVASIDGQDINLMAGIYLIVLSAFAWYGVDVLSKLAKIVNGKFVTKVGE